MKMIGTVSKVFLDSSVLIEDFKGSLNAFPTQFFLQNDVEFYMDTIVLSEYIYHFIAYHGGASPLALKGRKDEIAFIADHYEKNPILNSISFLPSSPSFVLEVPGLMKRFNLLPNDAIILATCLLHQITTLATIDTDFEKPCRELGIEFIHPSGYSQR